MKKVRQMILLMAVLLAVPCAVYADSINFYLYNWEGAMKDIDGALLELDDRVEFLWAGADGIINPLQSVPELPGFLSPGGDDVLIRAYGIGEGIPTLYVPAAYYNGHIEAFVDDLDISFYDDFGNVTTPYDDNFYVRFFNAEDPAAQVAATGRLGWGESEVFQITAPNVFGFSQDVNFSPEDVFVIHTLVIPEPLSFFMVLVGCGILKLFRMKK
jgi:hypothetical protein